MLYPIHNPPNPFQKDALEYFDDVPEADRSTGLTVFEDRSKTILAKNDSPDVGFRWSVNPYRGCYHACAYCYARPSHEYLGFGAGSDFDRKIVVKPDGARLLRQAFDNPKWQGELVMFSGVTDCYQPLENTYRLTRHLLEVCAEYRNPCAIITKSALVERDLDVLQELTRVASVTVNLSIPFFDADNARAIEPFVTTPARRLKTIERLAAAGIDVGVMTAPIIPGLNDEDMVRVLEAAAEAGAKRAGYVLLRLPGSVKDVFLGRLTAAFPERASKILGRLRQTRDGQLYDSRFLVRGRGEGQYADMVGQLFRSTVARLGMNVDEMPRTVQTFERPAPIARPSAQLALW